MSSASRSDGAAPLTLHASCVALDGRGLLILGASGSGKSGLALALMAHGARLVADDRTILTREGEALIASCPAPLSGLIEARAIGLLNAEPAGPVPVILAADLDAEETERLPTPHHICLHGLDIPLLRAAKTPHLAPALLQFLRAGRRDTP